MPRTHPAYILAALLLAAVLTAPAGCAPGVDLPESTDEVVARLRGDVPTIPGDVPDSALRRSGIHYYQKGRYRWSARYMERLLDRRPSDFMAAAYLGLSQWLTGHPDETRAAWSAYHCPSLPGLTRALTAEAAGLDLAAERLRAATAVYEAGAGRLPPMVTGLVAVAPFSAHQPPGLPGPIPPGLGTGLALRTALALPAGMASVPRDRFMAYLDKLRADPSKDTERVRVAARLAGAEYAVMGRLEPGDDDHVLTLRIMATETPARRKARLKKTRTNISESLRNIKHNRDEAGRQALIVDRALKYLDDKDALTRLLALRTDLDAATALFLDQGRLDQAAMYIKRREKAQADVKTVYRRMRRFEYTSFHERFNIFAHDRRSLKKLARTLAKQQDKATSNISTRMDRLAAIETRLAANPPLAGKTVGIRLSPGLCPSWPALAARELAMAAGLGDPGFPAPASGPDTETTARLGLALEARDAGNWAESSRLFAAVRHEVPVPLSPAPDFDLHALAGMDRNQAARTMEKRVLSVLGQARSEFMKTGGSGTSFRNRIHGDGP